MRCVLTCQAYPAVFPMGPSSLPVPGTLLPSGFSYKVIGVSTGAASWECSEAPASGSHPVPSLASEFKLSSQGLLIPIRLRHLPKTQVLSALSLSGSLDGQDL